MATNAEGEGKGHDRDEIHREDAAGEVRAPSVLARAATTRLQVDFHVHDILGQRTHRVEGQIALMVGEDLAEILENAKASLPGLLKALGGLTRFLVGPPEGEEEKHPEANDFLD